ncbi:hypothetical protein QVD17_03764 [Tagetes erecta]|uniref:Wound-responsive family protein n=1 Tax=Tagetes erecta TaxID=13708 RepID=A0AAD8LE59_TARER|nr:hypothetical protein QVD17_03764 [Tagetes erecta]
MSSLSRVWMAAGVAVVNGHSHRDQGYKLKSVFNSLLRRHGFTSSASCFRPFYGILQSNGSNDQDIIVDGGDNRKITCDDSLRQVIPKIRMSSTSRAWMVGGTVGLVEALKDQGFARWNYTIRAIHHHAKSNLRSLSQTNNVSSPATVAATGDIQEIRSKQHESEESLRKVMYLSCWGPN